MKGRDAAAAASGALLTMFWIAQAVSLFGDRLNNFFRGTMNLNSLSMPTPAGCSATGDAGNNGSLDGGSGGSDSWTSWSDSFVSSTDGGGWKPKYTGDHSSCDCRVGSAPAKGGEGAGLLLLLLLLARAGRVVRRRGS